MTPLLALVVMFGILMTAVVINAFINANLKIKRYKYLGTEKDTQIIKTVKDMNDDLESDSQHG